MKLLARAIATAAFLTATAFAAHSARLEATDVEGWLVAAYSNDRSGQFSHCTASAPYRDGTLLIFSIGKDFKWSMGFANPRWQLSVGSHFDLAYTVDAGPQLAARGRAINDTLVAVDLVDSRMLFDSFARAHQLYVQAAGETFVFNLDSSSRAVAAALECTRRYVAGSTMASNPFAGQGGPAQPAAPNSNEHKTEAAISVANVLSAAGIQGFRVIPGDQVPTALQKHDAVWLAEGGLTGLLNIETSPSFSNAEQVAASVMAADSETCKGAFASGRYPTQPQTGSARLMTACSGTVKPTLVNYTIAPRPRGGFYVLAIVGAPEGASVVQDAGARFHEAALKSLSGR